MKKHKVIWVIMFISLSVLFVATPIPAETTNTDVVVIGAGASGLAAALTAAQGGAKVIIFEKQPYPGGSSLFFQGMFAVESELQRKQYIGYTRDEAFKNIMDYSHWLANPRLVRAFVNESANTIAWLQQQGVEFTEASTLHPDGIRTYHLVKGFGASVVKALAAKAEEKGVDIRLATPVTKLVKQGDRVTGVIAEKDGKPIEVEAKAVVIATGGYANNKEWMKKYTGFDTDVNIFSIGQVGKTGDGIRMAWEAGGVEQGIGVLCGHRLGPRGPGAKELGPVGCAAVQPDLWVNKHGERFADETLHFDDALIGAVAARSKDYSYTIFDETIKKEMVEKGIERIMGQQNPPGTRLVEFDKEFNNALEMGNKDIFVADSVEELAKKIGIDPAVLRATVDEYNGYCEKGHDEVFAKNRKYLRPIKGPKFYAIRAYAVSLGTLGGIKINHKTEVVDKQEKPIPGLYAVGSDAGGMYGDTYPLAGASGTASAFAVNSGRIAGRNALKYIGK